MGTSKRVGFFPRLFAVLLDAIILGVLMQVLSIVLPNIFSAPTSWSMSGDGMPLSSIIISLLYTSLEIWTAATPGKMILKLKIKAQGGGAAATPALVIRWLIKQSAQILMLLFIITSIQILQTLQSIAALVVFIGCLFVFAKSKQALHDLIAKTAVFKG